MCLCISAAYQSKAGYESWIKKPWLKPKLRSGHADLALSCFAIVDIQCLKCLLPQTGKTCSEVACLLPNPVRKWWCAAYSVSWVSFCLSLKRTARTRILKTSLTFDLSCTVVPGGAAPLPQHPHHPGGHQAGPAGWQGHHWASEGQEAVAHHLPTGPCHGQRDR